MITVFGTVLLSSFFQPLDTCVLAGVPYVACSARSDWGRRLDNIPMYMACHDHTIMSSHIFFNWHTGYKFNSTRGFPGEGPPAAIASASDSQRALREAARTRQRMLDEVTTLHKRNAIVEAKLQENLARLAEMDIAMQKARKQAASAKSSRKSREKKQAQKRK